MLCVTSIIFIVLTFSLEEFKNILRDISFSKNKKNLTNLLSVLKSQFYEHMSKNFEQLLKEENVSELFSKKKLLTEEETKYVFKFFFFFIVQIYSSNFFLHL